VTLARITRGCLMSLHSLSATKILTRYIHR